MGGIYDWTIATRTVSMTRRVYQQIESTIGCLTAETGGMLGGDRLTGLVTHFHFDGLASNSGATYSPDTKELNGVLERNWAPQNVKLLGFVHSHPGGPSRPSLGDLAYADRILRAIPALSYLVLPIVLTRPDTGAFELLPYIAHRRGSKLLVDRCELHFVDVEEQPAESRFEHAPIFSRVRNAYDLSRLENSRVVAIGCGGASSFVEDLARAGVGEFVLIDPDTVSETNVATQQAYCSDLGLFKVDVLAERLRDINPQVVTVACPLRLNELDDCSFCYLAFTAIGRTVPATTLVCGMTDDFFAQARINRLALNFGLPSLCAQMYAQGMASEVTFTHPEITSACHRCILRSRYEAYVGGFTNDVTSNGSPYQSTARLNALKQFVALALLHHGTHHPRWGNVLTHVRNRNLAQIRHESGCELPAFHMAFEDKNPELLFCDETVWIPQEPDRTPCPDCGGQGGLRVVQGTYKDTRTVRA